MKYKAKEVDGVEVHFSADWIRDLEAEHHFIWYWNQAHLVYSSCSRDQKLLEIGVGTSWLSDLLKRRGWQAVTLDIDEEKCPDFCASAVDFDYGAQDIDVILAFEIFEHIPFSTFEKVIAKFAESNIQYVYFSLPCCEIEVASITLKLPKLRSRSLRLSMPSRKIRTKAHFWEIARREKKFDDEKRLITLRQLDGLFRSNGYLLKHERKVRYIQYFSATIIG